MQDVSDIVSTLGRDCLSSALGVGKTAISNAVVDNRFPAKWYAVIQDMCNAQAIDCPRDLFAFVQPERAAEAAE